MIMITNKLKQTLRNESPIALNSDHTWLFIKCKSKCATITAHHILKNEVDLIVPKFPESRKSKRGLFNTIISDFVGIAIEGNLSFYTIEDINPYIKQYSQCHLLRYTEEQTHAFRRYFSYVWSL